MDWLVIFFLVIAVIGIVEYVAIHEFNSWFDSISSGGTLTADRITSASNSVIQLDSFLVAGSIVGYFYLWERIVRKSPREVWLIVIPSVTIVGFSVSGLFAVSAILTVQPWYLRRSCDFLIGGIGSVILGWYGLQLVPGWLQEVREAKDHANPT